MPATLTRTPARPTPAKKPVPTRKKGGGVVAAVVVGGAAAGGLLWWLLSRRRASAGPPPGPPPADPVVNVGNDQATILDATSHAEVTISFSVVADNPVNLTWTRTSGPGPVNFSPLGPSQELVGFSVPGNYLLRLTATDTTDGRAHGFDELVVTVNEFLLAPILVPGELKVDGFASYILTRDLGDTVSFVWPVQNVGDLQGAAFIRLTEAGAVVGEGAPFPINPGQTVAVNFNPVVDLPLGVHILAATVMEGLPPDGIPVGAAQIITLTVVSVPVLSAVGLPTIDGIPGATAITRSAPFNVTVTVPVSWPCQNSGGGQGKARLKLVGKGTTSSALVTIFGNSTLTLLLSFSFVKLTPFIETYSQTLTMEDEFGVLLGQWQFTVTATN